MAELATIARPYAEALFETCRSDAAGTQCWLDTVAAAAQTPQLLQFAANPKVGAAEVFNLVTSVLPQPLSDRGANLLRTVIGNGRRAALPAVCRAVSRPRQRPERTLGRADLQRVPDRGG